MLVRFITSQISQHACLNTSSFSTDFVPQKIRERKRQTEIEEDRKIGKERCFSSLARERIQDLFGFSFIFSLYCSALDHTAIASPCVCLRLFVGLCLFRIQLPATKKNNENLRLDSVHYLLVFSYFTFQFFLFSSKLS